MEESYEEYYSGDEIGKTESCLVGIIPLSAMEANFGSEWPPFLTQISEGYSFIENAVYSVAMAGCNSIWIVCNDNISPLVKRRLGDYFLCPSQMKEGPSPASPITGIKNFKKIPIFYTPIGFEFTYRKNVVWSILYGARQAYKVSSKVSQWFKPDRYFVYFPYTVCPVDELKKAIKLAPAYKEVFFSYGGKTVLDDINLPFMFDSYTLRIGLNLILGRDEKYYKRWKRPKATRAKIGPADIFFILNEKRKKNVADKVPLSWYHEALDWEQYCDFISSPARKLIEAPLFGAINYESPESENPDG